MNLSVDAEDSSWENDEVNPVIEPTILNFNWTSDVIEHWKGDRTRKYPTIERGKRAAKVQEILAEKRKKIWEIRKSKLEQKKSVRFESPSPSTYHRKRARRPKPKNGTFEFPDFDFEDERTKDGIVAFTGTKKYEQACLKSEKEAAEQLSFNISDDEDMDVANKADSSLNTSSGKNDADDSDDEAPETIAVKPVKEDIEVRPEDDDEPPSFESIKKVKEDIPALPYPKSPHNFKRPHPSKKAVQKTRPVATFDQEGEINDDYVKVLRGGKRDQTFLEKLLEPEMKREKFEILQCLHYVCSKNFFGIGQK